MYTILTIINNNSANRRPSPNCSPNLIPVIIRITPNAIMTPKMLIVPIIADCIIVLSYFDFRFDKDNPNV